ncbi:MAG: dTDP-4-dehydrorhamnose reductase [Lachnospiraceae bacterium]|nr:dTDP-4-dehydrorhamnose reductase [Lachnospiraceae bacterium]
MSRNILVTGCNGQLGRAIQKEYANDDAKLILTDVVSGEGYISLDITNLEEVEAVVDKYDIDVIINCAAHTNVNACESQLELAYKINAIGPRNLCIAAKKRNAKVVQVSTDYVFSGDEGTTPLTEFDPVGPQSAYGRTKLAGEEFVKAFSDKYFILRTAWLFGDGNNFVKTMIKLGEERDEVGVVADQFGTPTSASELARMIHYLEPTDNYGVFHATCEGACNWADFAEEIFKQKGMNVKVKRLSTDEYPTPAKRPAYSVLDKCMLRLTTDFKMKEWKDALTEYMETL